MNFDDGYYNPVDAEDDILAGTDVDVGQEEYDVEDEQYEGDDISEGVAPNDMQEEEQEEPPTEETYTDPMDGLLNDWSQRFKEQTTTQSQPEEYEFLKTIQSSDLIKSIIKMRQNGFSEEQVQRAMGNAYLKTYGAETYGESQPKQEQEPLDMSDPNVLMGVIQQTVQQAMQQYVTPLQKEQERTRKQAEVQDIRNNNDRVLLASLGRVGLTAELTREQGEAIRVVAQTLYPGLDVTRDKLTQAQTDAIVTMALGRNMKMNKNDNRNLKAPQITSGKATSTSRDTIQKTQKTHGLTKSERVQNFNSLLKTIGG